MSGRKAKADRRRKSRSEAVQPHAQPNVVNPFVAFTLVIFFLSGIAGLGYQIVWARMFSVGLGHEMPSVFAVIVAFFGGLAIGAWALDGRVSRSRTPGRWYAGLEILIGAWALATIVLIPQLNSLIHELTGIAPSPTRHWLIAFGIPFFVLLPATIAMGATLPAMDRFVSALGRQGRTIGGLYAANTLGAAAGVLLSTFLIIPLVGFRMTIVLFALVNFFCAWAILRWPAEGEAERAPVIDPVEDNVAVWRLDMTLLLTGLLGIGYEIMGVRVIAQVVENTIYSYASALIVYLLFTAVGAAVYHRWARHSPFRPTMTMLMIGLATTCMMGIVMLSHADSIYSAVIMAGERGFGRGLLAEIMIATLVFALPTLLMGATFSHLAQAARREHGGVGRALGVNTIGGAIAPILFGVIMLPIYGALITLAVISLGYLLLIPELRQRRVLAAAMPIAMVFVLPPNLVLVTPPDGGSIRDYREGVMAAVSIVEDAGGGRQLKVNNLFHMGGTVGGFGERRMANIPMLLHPDPQRSLFLGIGTGITAGAATIYLSEPIRADSAPTSGNRRIDAVELVPEIVELMDHFGDHNYMLHDHPNVTMYVADARRFVRASRDSYDVIVADLYHPARDGTGALYTREHFAAIRKRLAPAGIFCQWLPLYQLDHEMLRLIVRTFLDVYPHAQAFIAHYNVHTPMLGLVGSKEPLMYAADWFEQRTRDTQIVQGLIAQQQALYDRFSLFGTYVADRQDLARLAGDGPLNTDDRPLVVFRAPRFIYVHQWQRHGRLMTLLNQATGDPRSLIEVDGDDVPAAAAAFIEELRSYQAARDLFLQGAVHQAEGRMDTAIEAFIESARRSRHFGTGYHTAHQFAMRLAGENPDAARAILERLRDADPSRPEAIRSLRQLPGGR
jgi:spermidine synthase